MSTSGTPAVKQRQMDDSQGRNVFIHPMRFDGDGRLVQEEIIVFSGITIAEAIERRFGGKTCDHGPKEALIGTASVIENGKVVKQTVFKQA
ncbi:hypothetical protein ASG68_24315 [Rhizobium sp. Leaf453]|nr:hypothetical protein ASG50_13980 [Rhizobium sp. Leaf386]KQU05894.1 hypothetical protein ASG68_24315 [Rhizobium sp. Leaf453]